MDTHQRVSFARMFREYKTQPIEDADIILVKVIIPNKEHTEGVKGYIVSVKGDRTANNVIRAHGCLRSTMDHILYNPTHISMDP